MKRQQRATQAHGCVPPPQVAGLATLFAPGTLRRAWNARIQRFILAYITRQVCAATCVRWRESSSDAHVYGLDFSARATKTTNVAGTT